ncbi:zinc protease [Rhodoligotrophos appendicifer]|uniref:M16 family metallopeptidase n=1 Tax=Rhodoligotrophos appendicifer TaxID=987056 RepID=UPI001185E597|nr:pitrilysin family protein [Rhodoligotrophos appendicifer]
MSLFTPFKRFTAGVGTVLLLALVSPLAATPADAVEIQEVTSPGGITAWLVQDKTVPMIAMEFAFQGGSAVDPKDRQGLANFLSTMLDEGAGDLDSQAFQKALETSAVKLSFDADQDNFSGSLKTLAANRDEAFRLLKLALNAPRFDAAPIERMRAQLLVSLQNRAKDPEHIASSNWMKLAFGDHPYANNSDGTIEGITAVQAEDLRSLKDKLFTRAGLKVAVVGDIDAEALGTALDSIFGALPDDTRLPEVAEVKVEQGPTIKVIDYDIPQSVIQFGAQGLKRNDPEFIPTYVMNYILGGGGFGSRLVEEVREKRGLSYSVYSYLWPLKHAGLMVGGAATRNDRAAETVKIIEAEVKRMADQGPTEQELADTKTYLTGSYALRFDSNSKIANELLGIQLENLGIDYINKRNEMVEAVSIEDVREAAKRLLGPGKLLFTLVGKPTNVAGTEG